MPPVRVAPKPTTVAAVASSGGAAAVSPALEKTVAAVAAAKEILASHGVTDTVADIPYTDAPQRDRRKLLIGVTAAAVAVLSLSAGWYVAHEGSAPSSAPTAPVVSSPASNNAVTNAAAVSTEAVPAAVSPSSAASGSVATPKGPSTTAAKKTEPAKTGTSTPVNTAPPAADAPLVVASGTARQTDTSAPMPPIAIASPNTAGMATLLAGPVAAPTLARTNISQGVTGGKQLVKVQPIYPSTARALHLSGVVTITAHVSTTGTVTDVRVIKGHPLLNAAAMDAVKRWKYQPFMLNGQAIENDINVQVKFDMPR
jgi:protein TonB